MKNAEIAERIKVHLQRFETDTEINKQTKSGPVHLRIDGTFPYWGVTSFASGRWIYVRYVSYQTSIPLSKQEALIYLEWLDAGNVGKHWKAL